MQARRTVPYAFNPALNSFGDGMGVPIFVRPDCPPEDASSASAAPKKEKRSKAGAQGARPQFRSALEQVWLTVYSAAAPPSCLCLSVCPSVSIFAGQLYGGLRWCTIWQGKRFQGYHLQLW